MEEELEVGDQVIPRDFYVFLFHVSRFHSGGQAWKNLIVATSLRWPLGICFASPADAVQKKKPADVFPGYSDSVGNNPTSLGQAQ
jgi:hypothetical protein